MDRNIIYLLTASAFRVALRKESVDRNSSSLKSCTEPLESLSVRRAWIEIPNSIRRCLMSVVALRKESVDRNCSVILSLMGNLVALRKESVDRN